MNLNREDMSLLSSDKTVTQTKNGFEIDTTGAAGATHRFEFKFPEGGINVTLLKAKMQIQMPTKDAIDVFQNQPWESFVWVFK